MVINRFSYLISSGLLMTIGLWIMASVISLVIGSLCGIARSQRLRIKFLSPSVDCFTFILRGIPFYVQLLLVYFVVPYALGGSLSAVNASIISLGLCSAGYVSNIVKAGVNAISAGQWEAAFVLGYTPYNTIRYIIFPQAFRIILPALIGECDQLLKSTAIVSAIGVLELTGVAKNIVAQEMNPLTMYGMLALFYLTLSACLALISRTIEKRLS
jgi:His/Glu/Gln/Arg/opine family amino acid ABC transporter permease subunit